MPSLFSGPPKPPPAPVMAPPENTALEAQLKAAQRRQGAQAAVLTGGSGVTQRAAVLTHSLTGQ